jgi:glycogen debranching enzyme
MDSIERVGHPIETQALFSKILHLAELVCEDEKYAEKRHKFLEKVREHYFKDGYLHDRYGDPTIRPNLFLAALFEPELLTKSEWESCFDIAIPPIWLEWGGLSSVDVHQECFCDVSTGECDISYHNGDSWFFVNNIAAMVLSNINAKKYANYIKGITDASIDEILWHNYIGAPGEVSSARALESWGCGLQGFSSSAFLYLVNRTSLNKKAAEELFA